MKRMNRKNKEGVRNLPLKVRAERAMKEAVAAALAEHKRHGNPIAVWPEWEGGLATGGRNRCAGSIVQCDRR